MAQYVNVVANANGTFTLEDLQQICIDGQSVQFVVEDINDGANLISQPIVAYAAAPDNTEQTLIAQPAINLAALDQTRQNVYIIKSNDPPVQQTIFSKTETANTRIQGSNNQLNVSTSQNWLNIQDHKESIELVKKDIPVRKLIPNAVRSQSQSSTTRVAAPNVTVQPGGDKKPVRIVPLTKRHSAGTPITILKAPVQGQNIQSAAGGKMKRISNPNNPNIVLPTRSRASTGGVSSFVSPPRGPQARPPIHQEANSLNLPKNVQSPSITPGMVTLSERIKQHTLRQKQQNERQTIQKQQQPVMAVTPTQRTTQQTQGVQRQRVMGQLLNREQQQQQKEQERQLLIQHNQQKQLLLQLQQRNKQQLAQQNRQMQTPVAEVEQPMEVDSSENVVHLERLNDVNCTTKFDSEENSSESVAYVQQEIHDPSTAIVQQQITGNEAKMLVILENGEQRLITFEVPKEDCTVQDLLEQVTANINSRQDPQVSLVSDPALGINYIVDTTFNRMACQEEEQESVSSESPNVTNVESKTPVKSIHTNPLIAPHSSVSDKAPKFIHGYLAVCPSCGMSAADFNHCMRCKRKLLDDVKRIPISTGLSPKKQTGVPADTFYKKGEPFKPDREAIAKRGRGRGRGTATRSKQFKEPVECLTISSDEEEENRKQKRLDDGKESNLHHATSEESETIFEKEPVITNSPSTSHSINSPNPIIGGGKDQSAPSDTAALSTYVTCRTVRIGSYKYIPNGQILLSSNGLRLEVPLLEDDKSFITVDIKINNLIKVLIHFAKSMPVLFFYTNANTGLLIRDLLGMQDPKGPYFDPTSKDHTHKRITLLPEKITDESKALLKEMYQGLFEELNNKEANDILVKASPKLKSQAQTPAKKQPSSSSSSSNSNGVIQTITVYPPPPAKGGIAINTEDFICLAEDQFLNDVIIDFYLKYLTSEVLSKNDHDRTHVFSSYFYKRLTSPHTQAADNSENLSPAAKRHARVQKWTKNVNIFEKDFVVIPINEHAHWFLAIICFPGLVGTISPKVEVKSEDQKLSEKKKKDAKILTIGNTTITPVSTITIDPNDDGSERDEAEGDDEEMESDSEDDDDTDSKSTTGKVSIDKTDCQTEENKNITKLPCILIFDSLAGASRSRVVATLRDYLSCEYQAKMGSEKMFSKDTIKGACPKVPQQSNFTDCGLYVLQYVESFFQTPLQDYTLPIKTLKNWFEEIIVTRKREEIAKLLIELVEKTRGNKIINLPTLVFPTQDGKLKQKSESQTDMKPIKSETESKKKVIEAGETKSNTATSTTENPDSSNESSTSISSQSTVAQCNQISGSTDSNLTLQKEATTTVSKTSSETMAYLKTKRIPRLQKASENLEEKQVAKKHKGESFDSCK